MARFHRVGEADIPFTPAEEAQRDAEEAVWTMRTTTPEWRNARLADHDREGLPRSVEDAWTTLVRKAVLAKADGPAPVLDRINAKRALRGEPPL